MTWNLEPPPNFQALHPDKPVRVFTRHLPHWRQSGATYFVTFRQGDSLPQNRIHELNTTRDEWERRNPPPRSQEVWNNLWRNSFLQIDQWLDEGNGSCLLGRSDYSSVVGESLLFFDKQRYELGCFVVMPNHVHLIVRPFDEDDEALSRITQSWKRHTSREINRMQGLKGEFWQDESYDRIVRDEEHLWRAIQYIGNNPAKAGLDPAVCQQWISPSWENLGWKFAKG